MEKKELKHIIFAIFLMSLVMSFFNNSITFNLNGIYEYLILLGYSSLIISVWIIGKKITAKNIGLDIEHNIFEFQRYNLPKSRKLKKPFPIGLVLPIILSFVSKGGIWMFTLLQFEATPNIVRALKKRRKKTFVDIMEFDLALISFWGILSLLLISLIANDLGVINLAKTTLYFIFWNMIPFGQLDGMKLFIGSPGPGKPVPILPVLYIFAWILIAIVSSIVLF